MRQFCHSTPHICVDWCLCGSHGEMSRNTQKSHLFLFFSCSQSLAAFSKGLAGGTDQGSVWLHSGVTLVPELYALCKCILHTFIHLQYYRNYKIGNSISSIIHQSIYHLSFHLNYSLYIILKSAKTYTSGLKFLFYLKKKGPLTPHSEVIVMVAGFVVDVCSILNNGQVVPESLLSKPL